MRLRSAAEARVGGDRRLEALERHVALAEAEQRLAAAGERRRVARIGDDRAIEVRRGVVEILPGQADVAEAGFGGIEIAATASARPRSFARRP